MPIIDLEAWKSWEENNREPYGKCCVDVARRAMEMLDEDSGLIDPYDLITKADDAITANCITGCMAGAIALMISKCHSRGEEFRKAWNLDCQGETENEKVNEKDYILDRTLLYIE